MTLSPCRTLPNVMQTQTCESYQLNKLFTPLMSLQFKALVLLPQQPYWMWISNCSKLYVKHHLTENIQDKKSAQIQGNKRDLVGFQPVQAMGYDENREWSDVRQHLLTKLTPFGSPDWCALECSVTYKKYCEYCWPLNFRWFQSLTHQCYIFNEKKQMNWLKKLKQ